MGALGFSLYILELLNVWLEKLLLINMLFLVSTLTSPWGVGGGVIFSSF